MPLFAPSKEFVAINGTLGDNRPVIRFSETLRKALADLGWTQTSLAEKAGIDRSAASKYASGALDPGADVLEKICKALPDEQRAELICAYLEDRIPSAGRELVSVTSSFGRKVKAPKMPPLGHEAREAIEGLARIVASEPDLVTLLIALKDALTRRRER